MRTHLTSTTPINVSALLFGSLIVAVVIFALGVWVGVNPPDSDSTTTATTSQVCPAP